MAKDQKKALSIIGSIVAVAVLGVAGWIIYNNDAGTSTAEQPEVLGEEEQNEKVSLVINFGDRKETYEASINEGDSALDVLRNAASENGFELAFQKFEGMGEFVSGIDGQVGGDDNFWGFYVNGEMAEVGAGVYEVKSGDLIEFIWTPMQ